MKHNTPYIVAAGAGFARAGSGSCLPETKGWQTVSSDPRPDFL